MNDIVEITTHFGIDLKKYYSPTYIECVDGKWFIKWPDGSLAHHQGFKNKAWATRTRNWLMDASKVER